ncbi:MAG: hypothetical protein H6703_07595 [Myxococcales bacterium]|nr:hypothetical protein [Myxococcales bacterium]
MPSADAKSADAIAADAPALWRWSLSTALPRGTIAAAAIDAPVAVYARLGGGETLAAAGWLVDGWRAAARAASGHDLFDPASWVHFGLDPYRPMGAALLALDPPVVAVGVALRDRERLRTLVYAHARGDAAVAEAEGDGAVWLTIGDTALVLRADAAWWVAGAGLLPGEAMGWARALGSGGFVDSRIGAAVAGLDAGRDLAVVVDAPALVDAVVRLRYDARVRDAARRVRAAEGLGDPAAVAAALTAKAALMADPAIPHGAAAAGIGRAVFAPFGPAALGLTLEARAARVAAAASFEAGSDVAALFRARPGKRPVASVFARPLVMLDLVFDPEAAWRLAGTAALAMGEGRAWAAAQDAAGAALGVSLEAAAAALAGGVGVAVELDPRGLAGVAGVEAAPSRLRVAAHVGVEDPAWARARLDALAAQGLLRAAAFDRWTAEAAGFGWQVALRGPRVFVASEAALIERFAPAGEVFSAGLPAPLPALLGGAHGGSAGWLDLAALGGLMLDHRPLYETTPLPPGDPLAELRAVEAAIEDASRAAREAQQRRGRALLAALGSAALAVEPSPGGVVARGGVFVGAPDLPAAVQAALRFAEEEAQAGRDLWPKTLQPLYDRRSRLLDAASPANGVSP